MPQPELVLVTALRLGEVSLERLQRVGEVIGMQPALPFVEAIGKLIVLVADLALPLRRELNRVRRPVPVP